MRSLRLSKTAERDLEEIGDYLAAENPVYALGLVESIRQACHRIAETPEVHSKVPRHEETGLRRMVFKRYLIFFLTSDTHVTVTRILHGARDYDSLLREQAERPEG